MYSAHGAQDPYRSGSALVDVTNSSLDCADLFDKTFNGQGYTTFCGDGQQQQQEYHQQHSPAPYPPLPPAAPTAPQAVCLPLPAAPTLPELVANYASPAAAAQERPGHLQSPPPPPPPPPPLPPAPPLHWPSSCYNFSTPPASAPYPPLPRAEAVSPASLSVEYAQYCPAAVDTPLPAAGSLVADYDSPAAGVHDGRGQSVSPPPPPPQPQSQPPSNENWVPPPPPPQWWQGSSVPPVIWPLQPPAAAPSAAAVAPPSSTSTMFVTGCGLARDDDNGQHQEQQQLHQRRYSAGADGQVGHPPLPPPPFQQPVPDSGAGEGVFCGQHEPSVAVSVGSKTSGGDSSSSSSSGGRGEKNSGRGRGPKSSSKTNSEKVNANTKGTSRDDAYVIPKKSRGSSQDRSREGRYGPQSRPNHYRDSDASTDREKSPYTGSSSGSRRGHAKDYFHRPNASSSSGRGSSSRRVRGPQEGDGHYTPYCNSGGGRDRDSGKHGGSSRRARDDHAIGSRYGRAGGSGGGGGTDDGRYMSGVRGDDRDGYRRRRRRDSEADGASPESDTRSGRGRDSGGSGRRDGEVRGRESGARRRGGGGKSCPPPSAEKRRDACVAAADGSSAVAVLSLAAEGDGDGDGDDELAELTSKLTALELDVKKAVVGVGASVAEEGKGETAGSAGKAYLSLEEYKEATAAGEMKPYKGTKYVTVDDRYADGWAYNPTTRRWIKVACQQKKDAIEALPALLARLELMENKDKLATQRSQLLETKVEKITKEKTTGRSTVSLSVKTAPVLVVFDTNWLIHNLADTKCRVKDIAGRHKDTSVLIAKEVLRELDRLKTRGRDEATRSSAQRANRYFRGLVESPLDQDREFPIVRVQEDTELFRDNGHHSRPESLGADDSILNCCMFFTQGIDTPRKVTLITGDNNFAIRASAHGLTTTGRPQCDPGRCRMPLCPAPSRPSPFSRGY